MFKLTGTTLGRYRITERLGRGGMAEVYKATHTRLDTLAAIKVLYSHLIEQEDFLARFEREAKAAAGLRHPNIVRVFDYDIENNLYYIVMDYIDGGTLKEKITAALRHGGLLEIDEVLRITRQIAEALDYAHQGGMVHRDIKSANILLDQKGNAFLSDFGIAHIVSSTNLTATGALIGTPMYMAPEQCQGKKATPASDIYSLGMILFEMLTGQVPFADDTPLAVIHKHIYEDLPQPREFRPDLSPRVEETIMKALEKNPEDRYASTIDLLNALVEAVPVAFEPQTIIMDADRTEETKTFAEEDLGQTEVMPEDILPEPEVELSEQATSADETPIDELATIADLSSDEFVQPPNFIEPEPQEVAAEISSPTAMQATVLDEEEPATVVDETPIPEPVEEKPAPSEREAATVVSSEPIEPLIEESAKPAPVFERPAKKKLPVGAIIGITAVIVVVLLLIWGFNAGWFSGGGGRAVSCDSPPDCVDRAWFFKDQGDVQNTKAYLARAEELIPPEDRPWNAALMCDATEIMMYLGEYDVAGHYLEACWDWSEGVGGLEDIHNWARDLAHQLESK